MRILETKVYTFEELSAEAKERAIEENRYINVEYYEWYHNVYDTFKYKYSDLFETTNIYFSGFHSQGDGAMFEYDYITDKLINEFMAQLNLSELRKKLVKELVYFIGYGRHSGRYYHERSCSHNLYVELNGASSYMYSNIHKFLIELELDFEAYIEERYIELAQELYDMLYNEYEYLTSDEVIADTLISNEYEFTKTGRQNMNELQEYKLLNQVTQKELAEMLGLTESKVSRLMKVKTSLKDILTHSEYEEMMQRIE